jgi:hypothetical protein
MIIDAKFFFSLTLSSPGLGPHNWNRIFVGTTQFLGGIYVIERVGSN